MIKKPAKKSVKVAAVENNPLQLLVDALNALQNNQQAVKTVKTAGKTKEVNRYESISYPGVKIWRSNPVDKDSFCFAELVNDELTELEFTKDEYKSKRK